MPRRLSSCAAFMAIIIALPSSAYGQGEEAKKMQTELLKSAGDARFSAIVDSSLGALSSAEDTLWILGTAAAAAAIPDQRKGILGSKASILELLGRYGEAGLAWEAAATAMPGPADPTLLLSAAFCMLASGDAESASRLAEAVAFLAPDPVSAKLAGIVGAWTTTIGQTGDAVPDSVKPLLADENPRVALSALLLARTVSAGTVREGYDKLIALRFPSIADSVKSTTYPSMLLYVAKDSPGVADPMIITPAAAAEPVQAIPEAASALRFFQVGAYRNGANAEAVASSLKAIGVQAYTKHKPERELYIVFVSAGSDPAKTVLTLKDAGYEAWPLESAP